MAAPDFQETCPRHNPVNPGAAAAVSAAAICQKVNATCPITYSDTGRMSRVPSGISGRLCVVWTAGQNRPFGHIRQHSCPKDLTISRPKDISEQYPTHRKILKHCPLYDVLFHKSFNNALELENPLQQPRPYDFRIVGSCNGLLCILDAEKEDVVFIYNPTTRRLNILPLTGLSGVYFYGFGYDELSNDYKVVITDTGSKFATRILSVKSGEWKEIGQFPYAFRTGDGKLLNGAIHWAARDANSLSSWKIVSLDLAKETYGEVLQPKYPEGLDYLELGVLGDWLCVLGDYIGKCVANVWVMKVYGVKDTWTKLASIPYPHTWNDQILAPFYISEDGKLMLKFGRRLVVYDSKDSSSSVIDNFIECLEACTVVESLVSPFVLAGNNDD